MSKLFAAADRFLDICTWKDMGILIGIALPARKKRPAAWAASLVFVAAYIPLMAKFLPFLIGDRIAIEDIYG